VVRTQYANWNDFFSGLCAPCYILNYLSQALLDILDRQQSSVLVVNFNRVSPIVDHDKNFSGVGHMWWGLGAQRIAVGLGNAIGIKYLCDGLLKP
jgi:hypothetical protein